MYKSSGNLFFVNKTKKTELNISLPFTGAS